MIGTALAVHISDIPFEGPCAMTQMGLVDGEFIVNPSQKQWDEGDLQLTVASTKEKVIMIEAGANVVPEAKMIEMCIRDSRDIIETLSGTDYAVKSASSGIEDEAQKVVRNKFAKKDEPKADTKQEAKSEDKSADRRCV